MKITEYIQLSDHPFISFEIIPPKRGGNLKQLIKLIKALKKFNPPFIDVTSHASEVVYEENPIGIKKKTIRKRPGTLGVCALIQHKFRIEAVPHILCHGFTQEETEDFLIDVRYLEIENLLALQGDERGFEKPLEFNRSRNLYANELVAQIARLNQGIYLSEFSDETPTDFCIGVAGYPEKHFESPNLQLDIQFTKAKIDAGAHYIVTQLFYDNHHFFNYVQLCRQAGITVPIIPGLKIIFRKRQLHSIPRFFHVDIPQELVEQVLSCDSDDEVAEVGIRWAVQQIKDLVDFGVPGIHFYVLEDPTYVQRVLGAVQEAGFAVNPPLHS